MANPSTTGPSGAGTEVIRRYSVNGVNDAYSNLTVPADHIYTLLCLNIIDYESAGSATNTLSFGFDNETNGDCWLVSDQNINPRETFVYNEKVCFTEGDEIKIFCSSTNYDAMLTFIDQEFA